MKKLLITIFITLFCAPVFAENEEYISPMSMYKDNYFVAGDMDNQVKFQISAKYNIVFSKGHNEPGFYFGYTQTSWWKVYKGADTFSTNYQPEGFYRFEPGSSNIFGIMKSDVPYLDYFQISPIQHASTGVETSDHRSINIYYAQLQMATPTTLSIGFNTKIFGYYYKDKANSDINDYRKFYEADIFLKLRSRTITLLDRYELHTKCTGNPLGKGYVMLEGTFQLVTAEFQPRLFIQYNRGYGVNMVNYNKKETELRAGFVF